MKVKILQNYKSVLLVCITLFSLQIMNAQNDNFWSRVRFGGNIGIGFTNDTFSGIIAPSAVYDVNPWFSAGLGLSFGYTSFKAVNGKRNSTNYGGSIITLFNPLPGLQLSAEFEETSVNRTVTIDRETFRDNYWYPALFVGAGYQIGFVSIGLRYDVLYDEDKSIYGSAYVPFVRVFF